MAFKPTLRQALGLAIIRGCDVAELVKHMSEEEAKEFMIAVHLVKEKLEKGDYKDRDYTPGSADVANNARRKAKNIAGGSTTGVASMPHQKPWGGSGPSAAVVQAKKQKKMSAKNPTKVLDGEGKVIDMVHSSGRNKGKSIYSSEEERKKKHG